MAFKIRPSRRGNFDLTAARLRELGVGFVGYDHRERCYVDVTISEDQLALAREDPLIEVELDAAPQPRRSGPLWSSSAPDPDLGEIGRRLLRLRTGAGLSLEQAAELVGGGLSADEIDDIERTGRCDARRLIALADLYGASLDHIAGRFVARGNRRG